MIQHIKNQINNEKLTRGHQRTSSPQNSKSKPILRFNFTKRIKSLRTNTRSKRAFLEKWVGAVGNGRLLHTNYHSSQPSAGSENTPGNQFHDMRPIGEIYQRDYNCTVANANFSKDKRITEESLQVHKSSRFDNFQYFVKLPCF